ncbi:Bax inhibitor-1/YccA family protein [Rickettsiales endosymbiont of Peranema trichophorum]|uniref:Bax inhibitor-1/YccA family protein n=1 Tax=Rickettsiales endosymbiont of Peranema trichophorum TaxID=2486577 RepID=UPI0010237587|nr:Bax inhibitor-1/YccA family protein [Rickettsiales endosymbiont of Peranema trichophorum]RZI47331.1 Bax inhibitor-1/YccA family protein [Rickettsiales endosymbiont of Peranema trichophorum]
MDYTKFTPRYDYYSDTTSYDVGLRNYMIAVYRYMGIALSVTGLVAYLISTSAGLLNFLFNSPFLWIVMFSPFILVMFMSSRFNSMSLQTAQTYFWLYAVLVGVSFSTIFAYYTIESITRVFFITSSLFAAMSLYGYTTKRDLTGVGAFLMMGLIGMILLSLVNMFLGSSMLYFVYSTIALFIFIGLTAYDVQRIKQSYYHVSSSNTGELVSKIAVFGALSLYMDFINMFIYMLQFLGNRR